MAALEISNYIQPMVAIPYTQSSTEEDLFCNIFYDLSKKILFQRYTCKSEEERESFSFYGEKKITPLFMKEYSFENYFQKSRDLDKTTKEVFERNLGKVYTNIHGKSVEFSQRRETLSLNSRFLEDYSNLGLLYNVVLNQTITYLDATKGEKQISDSILEESLRVSALKEEEKKAPGKEISTKIE